MAAKEKGFAGTTSGTLVRQWLLPESCVLPGLLSKRAWWQSPYELGMQDAHPRGISAHSCFQLSVELCGLGLESSLFGGCWPWTCSWEHFLPLAPVLASSGEEKHFPHHVC